ncbi:MAG: hypothetical protein JJU03_07050 [Idiomarina sp.]|nr:hypothetical protein [Idiomarina sp.]
MDILSRTFLLAAITGVFALTACSSDDPSVNEQLSFQADFADVVSMRAVGDDLLFTAGSSLYRLDSSGEYSLEVSAATSGRAFVEVLDQDHYILVNADRRVFRETTDGGATWSLGAAESAQCISPGFKVGTAEATNLRSTCEIYF